MIIIDETGAVDSHDVYSVERPYVASVLRKHKLGEKLPRGKAFDRYRHLESKTTASSLGGVILSDLRKVMSHLHGTTENIG